MGRDYKDAAAQLQVLTMDVQKVNRDNVDNDAEPAGRRRWAIVGAGIVRGRGRYCARDVGVGAKLLRRPLWMEDLIYSIYRGRG